jgi:hypothetical protein
MMTRWSTDACRRDPSIVSSNLTNPTSSHRVFWIPDGVCFSNRTENLFPTGMKKFSRSRHLRGLPASGPLAGHNGADDRVRDTCERYLRPPRGALRGGGTGHTLRYGGICSHQETPEKGFIRENRIPIPPCGTPRLEMFIIAEGHILIIRS